MVRQLSDYVQVYEDTLAPGQCQALIDRFEAAPTLQERTPAERAFRFVELNVSRHWPEVESHIFGVMMNYIQRYWEALAVGPCWPTKVDAERIRLKRYMPGGQDHFPPHVDVTNAEESRRFLTAILYLNDPGGGETVFPGLDLQVMPAPGRMVIFPPLWLFPHAGLPPRDRPKYILHRYLWYPPAHAPQGR
jgi:prolyl 4-hydroxylase